MSPAEDTIKIINQEPPKHICQKEGKIAEMQTKINNLQYREDKILKSIETLEYSQRELTKTITELNATFQTIKWFMIVIIIPSALWLIKQIIPLL